jgi:exodeoxyribonuclease VII small subunit
MNTDTARPIETLSFEDALVELEDIVKTLETGQTKLDSSISSYERGIALKQHCEKQLSSAQTKIEKITIGQDGAASTAPFDSE